MIISTIISSLTGQFAKKSYDKKSKKEGIKEANNEDNLYLNESCFVVHKPKYIIPLCVFAIIFFLGFAAFSYECEILICMYAFLAIDVFFLYLLLRECYFRIEIDRFEITIKRFLRKTLVCSSSDITSCRVDNAGNVSVYFGYIKIDIESTMINAKRFADFASSCAFENSRHLQRKYKVYNKGTMFVLIMIAVLICAAVIFYPNLKINRHPNGDLEIIDYVLILFASISWWCIYKFVLFYKTIKVDEKNRSFFYRKGFKLKKADFSQIAKIETKKRFLEENAINYIFYITNPNPDGKIDIIKFSTFEENSDSFFNAVYSCEEF